jgi:hypothetical protein
MEIVANEEMELEARIVAFDNLESLVEQYDNAESKYDSLLI